MKTFTRYDAEHHDPATRYVLAEDAEARVKELELTQYGSGRLEALRAERDALQRQLDLERLRHAATRAELEAAPTYPVENPANPLLTVESGGIRYVLEAMSDADGDWFEVKSATPTEAMTPTDIDIATRMSIGHTLYRAHEALRQWREEHQRDV